jgi:hypothetical protein
MPGNTTSPILERVLLHTSIGVEERQSLCGGLPALLVTVLPSVY